jgi:hypothetical protein
MAAALSFLRARMSRGVGMTNVAVFISSGNFAKFLPSSYFVAAQ